VLSARAAAEAPEPISPDPARLMADHFADAYGGAGQALAFGHWWAELHSMLFRSPSHSSPVTYERMAATRSTP
jgi:hypothetical protein